jgi:hypothetical protein
MRRKKEPNLNGDPSSKTRRACTNDDENVTARQETKEGTVGNGEQRRQERRKGHSWQSINENKERGNMEVLTSKTKSLASKFVSYL